MKTLVTGAAGYLGHVLCPMLSAVGHEVRGLDNLMYRQEFPGGIEEMRGSITSIADMYKATEGVDVVIALAAIVGDDVSDIDQEETIRVNYESTKLLVEMCEMNGVKRIIFPSTCSVYGDVGEVLSVHGKAKPLSLYAKTRLMSEKVLGKAVFKRVESVYIFRLGTLFGWSGRMRFDLVANYMVAKAVADGEIIVHGGRQSRPMLHVKDAAGLMLESVDCLSFHFHSLLTHNAVGKNYTVKKIAKIVAKQISGTKIKYEGKDDARNYHVLPTEFGGSYPQFSLTDGIKEIIKNLPSLDGIYTDNKYHNTKAWRK